jgi:periplasmic mercuric ion binding protein
MRNRVFFQLILLVAFTFTTYSSNAQVMAKKPEWVTIKSENLKCWVCKQRLNDYLMKESVASFESGIIELKFNLIAGELKVKFYPDRIDIDDIKLAMNNAGFDADAEKATPDSYKKLPPPCKYANEGGGPQKGKPCHIEPDNN